MTEQTGWFGSPGAPLAARVTWPAAAHPAGTAPAGADPAGPPPRGAVVVCPALLGEQVNAERSLRLLAAELADAGALVVRPDYAGTGDSAGLGDQPGQVQAWRDSIAAAVQWARGRGAGRVALVGLRVGATLAGTIASAVGADAVVLWDPCVSGRSWLREQRALLAVGDVAATEGGLLGTHLPPAVEAELAELSLLDAAVPLVPVLVLTRAGRATPRGLRETWSSARWEETTEQAALLGVSSVLSRPATRTVELIAGWLQESLGLRPPTSARPTAAPGAGAEGRLDAGPVEVLPGVRERFVWMGPRRLAGVLTEPAGVARRRTVVVFLNLAAERHLGPERAWVNLSRDLAVSGLRSLRFDLAGIGDSPAPASGRQDDAYPATAVRDMTEAISAVTDDPSDVVLVGVCSGAHHALLAGVALHPRGVVVINPPTEIPVTIEDRQVAAERSLRPSPRWIRRLGNTSLLARTEAHIPDQAWWLLHRLGVVASPAAVLRRLVAAGTTSLLVCGPMEIRPFRDRAALDLRALQRSPAFRLEVLDDLDHSLLRSAPRQRALSLLHEHLLATLQPVA